MVEEDTVACEDIVGFAVVHDDPVAVQFCHAVRAAGIERCLLGLGDFLDLAVQFACGCLIEAVFSPVSRIASRKRTVPTASTSAVYSGSSNETLTWLWAARL